jgi:hypothetical protein
MVQQNSSRSPQNSGQKSRQLHQNKSDYFHFENKLDWRGDVNLSKCHEKSIKCCKIFIYQLLNFES